MIPSIALPSFLNYPKFLNSKLVGVSGIVAWRTAMANNILTLSTTIKLISKQLRYAGPRMIGHVDYRS